MERSDGPAASDVRRIALPRLGILPSATGSIAGVLFAAFLVHAAMLAYDLAHPDVFLNADRALSRFETIRGLHGAWADGTAADFLASHGIAGDYLVQAVIIALAGNAGLVVLQVGLALIAGYGVFRLGRILGLSTQFAALAGAIYLALPHTLLFAHQLAAEGLYSPLLTISVWLAAEFVARPRAGLLVAGALLLGLANLIRPVTMLWPLVVGFALGSLGRSRHGLAYLAVSAVPVLAWMSFIAIETGSFGLGKADHDLGHNLYQRVMRISETMPGRDAATVRQRFLDQGPEGSLGVPAYLEFGWRHPLPFLRHAARDAVVFVAKSGIERIPIDYLGINAEARAAMQDSASGWRAHLERHGVMPTLRMLWQTQGIVLAVSLAGSLLLLALVAAAIAGGWHLRSNWPKLASGQRFAALLLVALPLYVLLFSQVVDAAQSRHRAPAEAALVLLAVVGGLHIRNRKQ